MSKKINCIQAYKAMMLFFDMIAFETCDVEVSVFASFGILYSAIPGECPQTWDPAKWHDWMDGLKIVIGDDSITYKFKLTIEQAYAAAYQYIVIFCDLGAEPSVHQLKDAVNPKVFDSIIKSWFWNKWLKAVEFVLRENTSKKVGHFFGEATEVDKRESFGVMKVFLDNYCQKNYNKDLIGLVKNCRLKNHDNYWSPVSDIIDPRVWEVWQDAIIETMREEKYPVLNLLVAFEVMFLFLLNYFDDDQVTILKEMILKFNVDKNNKPINFSFWRDWIGAAVQLNAEQTELVYDLVSIKKPISESIAFEIIKAWFVKYQDLLGADFVQGLILDQKKWQKAVDQIKQQQRSYLLLDDEVTVLEAYHIMLKILELAGKNVEEFAIDHEQQNKPKDFLILLEWLMVAEKIVKK